MQQHHAAAANANHGAIVGLQVIDPWRALLPWLLSMFAIYSLTFEMFDTVDFLAHVSPFVLFKNFCEIYKIICYIKIYIIMNQMIGKKLIIT
jgi:hypothetical protein